MKNKERQEKRKEEEKVKWHSGEKAARSENGVEKNEKKKGNENERKRTFEKECTHNVRACVCLNVYIG